MKIVEKLIVSAGLFYTRVRTKIKNVYFNFYNTSYLKYCGAQLGSNLIILGETQLYIKGKTDISIGNNCNIRSRYQGGHLSHCRPSSIVVRPNAKLQIGNNVGMTSVVLYCFNSIIIGNYVKIGSGAILLDSDAHSMDFEIRRTPEDHANRMDAPIIIEDDVFIGADAFIMKGVTIGRGAMVSVRSVVRSSIPPYAIVLGNPAKIVGFVASPDEIIEKESRLYPEQERLPLELLEKNYNKYFINRIKDIKSFTKI